MYHTSPNKITEGSIHEFGVAGSCLFFSDDIYQMSADNVYVYKADFDCVAAYRLDDETAIAEIAEHFGVNEDTAEGLLDGSVEWEGHIGAEDSWWLQGRRGEAAARMGYDGAKDRDEQGTVYIVPMKGREGELTEVS